MNDYEHERRGERAVEPIHHKALPARCSELDPQMDKYLQSRQLDPLLARFNGWYPSLEAGDGLARVVMPGTNSAGFPFWQARAMVPTPKRYQSPHSPRKDSVILTYPFSKRPRPVVIVEGPMDALAASGAGFVGIALMGNTPNLEVFDFIAMMCKTRQAIALPDREADSEEKGGWWLSELALRGVRVVLARMSDADMLTHRLAKDLCELPPRERVRLLTEALRA